MVKILCIGDVVGKDGVDYLTSGGRLMKLRQRLGAGLVIVNGENSAEGNGMTAATAEAIYRGGADVITGGNHTFKWREVYSVLDDGEFGTVRPANYPSTVPGVGYTIADAAGYRVLVMNLLGTVYMESMTPPIECAARILRNEEGRYDFAVCDIHAEATSEKLCLARYFDGNMAVVFGTHTHVQTADAQVLPGGTGYITDLGMCGSHNGILGVRTEDIIKKFTEHIPVRFTPAKGEVYLTGALFTVNPSTGKCVSAELVRE